MLFFVASPAPAQNFELEKLFPQVQCMALNVYYEARGSNLADRAAVADVVLNRVNDSRYPDTVCGVVKQGLQNADGSMRRNKCQFSWYCDGKADGRYLLRGIGKIGLRLCYRRRLCQRPLR